MDITLFQSIDELREVLDQVNEETGELPEGFESAIGLVKRKGAAVGAYILQTEREAEFVESYAKQLLSRARSSRKRIEWLRGYLLHGMREAGIRIIDIEGIASVKRLPERDKSVDIWDERQVPAEYLADPTPLLPSKTKIRAALEAGIDVPGARLVAKDRLQIR